MVSGAGKAERRQSIPAQKRSGTKRSGAKAERRKSGAAQSIGLTTSAWHESSVAPVSWSARIVVVGDASSSIGTKYGEMGGANSGASPALAECARRAERRAEAARRSIVTAVLVVVGWSRSRRWPDSGN